MSVIVKATAQSGHGDDFTVSVEYTSQVVDSAGVVFIGDDGTPRHVPWGTLRNTNAWVISAVFTVEINTVTTQTYP